jgi:hypothetical protein
MGGNRSATLTRETPMPRIPAAALLAGAASLALGACSVVPLTCTDEARPTLSVEVRDARTGVPAAQGARGVIREGTYSDSLRAVTETLLVAENTFERPGTYDVTVEKAGYLAWTERGVVVTADACHVRSRTITARLEPAP